MAFMDEDQKEHRAAFWHTAAHLLGHAVLQLYPDAKRTIGPAIENGFYYDFYRETPFTPEDLKKIEKRMEEIAAQNHKLFKEDVPVSQTKELSKDNPFKLELIDEFSQGKDTLSFYCHADYKDLCKGGHIENTGEIKAIKLLKTAGAYWRGDAKNPQLQRIYGIAFPSDKELKEYIHRLEEAEKRDHRKIGAEMDLFVFSDLVGAGLPLWTPKGTILRDLLDGFVWELRRKRGYVKVTIPHITKKDLYETSGHWQKFKDDLFHVQSREGHEFAMKPMNCPHHTQIFGHILRSYRDMPHRYCETTMCYRDEQSGELHGMSRLRSFTQDDAHVFCRQSQVKEEFLKIWDIVNEFYGAFGFELRVRLSLHDPAHFEKYLGTPELWKEAEKALKEIAQERGVKAAEAIGEAAFYGPKIDFMTKDALGREWQVATIQLDINMPERFDLVCINEKSERERIVMIHAAIMGATERFLSVYLEHCMGKFPLWLNPVQVKILNITENQLEYAHSVMNKLKEAGLRVELDDRSLTLGKKIREAQLEQASYIVVIGDKEVQEGTVNIRTREGGVQGSKAVEVFIAELLSEIAKRG